jgi:hypothetical protein
VRLGEWRLADHESESAGVQVLDWCREVIAGCRRPFGIDAFDLAVACRRSLAHNVQTLRFLRLRPTDLYSEGLPAQLAALLSREHSDGSPVFVAAAIFSWGDAAHEALPAGA